VKTSTPALLTTHYGAGTTTTADLLKITRKDGAIYAFTSASESVTIGGVVYASAQGLDISSLEVSAGLNVDNLELTTLDDGSTFVRSEVLAGVWRNADFVISRYNWSTPTDGVEVRMVGTVGEVHLRRGSIVAELRGLQQYLQQPIGSVSSKTCRARLGDTMCRVVLSGYTVAGTITAVASNQTFTDSSKAQAAEYFNEGILTFTSGPLIGLSSKVKTFAGGVFVLALPMLQTPVVGNTFSVIAGCQKRLSDCTGKFNNVLNFQGEPHLPGIDAMVTAP
jgi:uncharacterized phage protein (TIGR02218 family)